MGSFQHGCVEFQTWNSEAAAAQSTSLSLRHSLSLQVCGNASEKIQQGSSLTVGVQSAWFGLVWGSGVSEGTELVQLDDSIQAVFLPTLQFPASLHSYNESIILQPLLNGMRNCGFVGLTHKIPSGTWTGAVLCPDVQRQTDGQEKVH